MSILLPCIDGIRQRIHAVRRLPALPVMRIVALALLIMLDKANKIAHLQLSAQDLERLLLQLSIGLVSKHFEVAVIQIYFHVDDRISKLL